MSQNKSSAVMAQRNAPRTSSDFYPTPLWATRALFECAPIAGFGPSCVIREPAAGMGHMVEALGEYGGQVYPSDAFDYGRQFAIVDFLATLPFVQSFACDWVITNPPFKHFTEFVEIALQRATIGVAMFGRIQTLETEERYQRIFLEHAGRWQWRQFVERVPLALGRIHDGSTASSYGWLIVWTEAAAYRPETPFLHIAPCRSALERADDYRGAYQFDDPDWGPLSRRAA